VADVPVHGEELTARGPGTETDIAAAIPASVLELLESLWAAGYAAYVVGGSVRDVLMGRDAVDWDLATSALPDQTEALFPDTLYENAFGTVAVGTDDPAVGEVEITTFRSDHDYADFRRPHRVEFSDSIELDLARRDVTVNAIAWGAPAGGPAAGQAPRVVDPFGGRADIAARVLRTVGDPRDRFAEDALRMLRVVRFATTLGFEVDAATLAGIQAQAHLVAHLSGERIRMELAAILGAPVPSVGLRLLADTGLLASISPELAAQRGVPQNKIEGEDLWDHTVRAVDAAVPEPSYIRMAALLHDIGKPATMADGRFLGHDTLGAEVADALLERLRWPRHERERIDHIVRHHMYGYLPTWSDAAVRRFIAKVGRDALDDLFLLREADNVGSGRARDGGGLGEIRERVAAQLSSGIVLELRDLDIDGDVLMEELGLTPSPRLGLVLHELLERAIADPTINKRPRLLALARSLVEGGLA
jgi:tRNA nucleotidyltransferase (CCA-adding enzyme)